MPGELSQFVLFSGPHTDDASLRHLGPVPHDASYYSKCMLGGVLACGLTHAGITPLDVAKCNMQVSTVASRGNRWLTFHF
jgi:solute carrier family 25 phosphate transporter 3